MNRHHLSWVTLINILCFGCAFFSSTLEMEQRSRETLLRFVRSFRRSEVGFCLARLGNYPFFFIIMIKWWEFTRSTPLPRFTHLTPRLHVTTYRIFSISIIAFLKERQEPLAATEMDRGWLCQELFPMLFLSEGTMPMIYEYALERSGRMKCIG